MDTASNNHEWEDCKFAFPAGSSALATTSSLSPLAPFLLSFRGIFFPVIFASSFLGSY